MLLCLDIGSGVVDFDVELCLFGGEKDYRAEGGFGFIVEHGRSVSNLESSSFGWMLNNERKTLQI